MERIEWSVVATIMFENDVSRCRYVARAKALNERNNKIEYRNHCVTFNIARRIFVLKMEIIASIV